MLPALMIGLTRSTPKFLGTTKEWNWSLGVGAGAGFWWGVMGAYVGAVGHCGVAYDFWFPLELSVDYRPNIGAWFGDGWADFYGYGLYTGISIGVRYKF